ncbi:caspase family protein [Cetobacterium sp.]|uniref:caspase family protein n=1 Tax=Cetobacterium sp. TaxID=2071632 RepID=UPI003F2C06B4
MRKGLCIGLNYLESSPLGGCVEDAKKIKKLLSRNADQTKNIEINLITDEGTKITTNSLKKSIDNLFKENSDEMELILFYFSGHGYLNENGGFLVTNDTNEYSEGVSMDFLLNCVSHSKARNKVIILDCCHAGQMGNPSIDFQNAHLPTGVTILTSCKNNELSYEKNNKGVFTELLCFALEGEAKDIFGNIAASSIYSYIDSSLGSFEQRPIFKTNISKSVILRKANPSVDVNILRELLSFFPTIDYKYDLSPEFEPEIDKNVDLSEYPFIDPKIKPDKEKVKIFEKFQNLNRHGLLVPTNEKHMFYAAIKSDTCELTTIGKHYWRLAEKERI